MKTVNTDLIEKILLVNDKLIKFADKNIFNNTNLTPTQFNILGEIILNKKLTINNLKEKLIISAPALSQLLNRMEKQKLIERQIWKKDKREITLISTKIGKELYKEINEKYIELADKKFWVLKDTDKGNMIKLLWKIEEIIK